jgi:mTERF domain-containing protein
LLDLGLAKRQIAKVVAMFPQILGYSIEQNLKPTSRWLQKFGVSDKRLQRLITNWPRFLGFSLANKLEPAAVLLESFCPLKGARAREIIANNPEILRFSYKRLAARLRILSSPRTSNVYYAMCLTDALFEQRFGSER